MKLVAKMNIIKRISNIVFHRNYSIWRTLYFNFKVFPVNVAKHLPIKIGKHVEMIGLYRGCVVLGGGKTKRFMSEIGTCKFPMYATSGSHTLIRFGSIGTKLVIGKQVEILAGSSLILTYHGKLTLGDDIIINQNTMVYCAYSVTIGNHARIGWQSQIYDSDFHYIYNEERHTIAKCYGSVHIGNNVWLANRVTVSKNAFIPDYAIVASNSLVNKDFSDINEKGCFFAGIPAKYRGKVGLRIINEPYQYSLYLHFMKTGDKEKTTEKQEEWFTKRY